MKNLFTILLLLITFLSYSQIDQKAKSILDKVSETTKNYSSITANFEFIMENAEVDLKESNEGFLIIQDEKYKLSINGVEIFSDSESQWTYIIDAEEVNISEAGNEEEGSINPASIFTIYEEGFRYVYLGEFTKGSLQTYKIDLIPTEEKDFTRVILEINQSNLQIISAILYETDENTYTINVKNMETSKRYEASTFTFDSKNHPNVDIIDMR